jgi:hypothetical protein
MLCDAELRAIKASAGKQVHVFFFKKCDADVARSCFVFKGLTITATLDATINAKRRAHLDESTQ